MKRKSLIIMVAVLLMPFLAGAQALKGSYFLDNSLNRNKMNPAFAPRSNYFQIPAVGNLGTGVLSNLDIPTFLYPSGGELLTFLHPSISVEQFGKALPEVSAPGCRGLCKSCEFRFLWRSEVIHHI